MESGTEIAENISFSCSLQATHFPGNIFRRSDLGLYRDNPACDHRIGPGITMRVDRDRENEALAWQVLHGQR